MVSTLAVLVFARSISHWRMATLFVLGAWLVHQLRFALAFSTEAPAHVGAHGHNYLDFAGPLLAWAAAIAAASWILSLATGEGELGRAHVQRTTWPRASLALLLIYCLQEAVEASVAPGHPPLLSSILGDGGWLALPLCLAFGGLIALTVRGARSVRRAVARRRSAARPRRAGSYLRPPRPAVLPRWQSHLLAANLAGRAPPA